MFHSNINTIVLLKPIMLLSISVKYSHSYEINVCCLRDAPYGGFPFPSVCFSNQQMLVLLQDHSASTSSLFDICDKKAIFITVRTLVFWGLICISRNRRHLSPRSTNPAVNWPSKGTQQQQRNVWRLKNFEKYLSINLFKYKCATGSW